MITELTSNFGAQIFDCWTSGRRGVSEETIQGHIVWGELVDRKKLEACSKIVKPLFLKVVGDVLDLSA